MSGPGPAFRPPSCRPLPPLLFALFLLVPPLLLHVQHLGPGRIPYLRDLSRTHLPFKKVAVEEMRAGRLPRWNPGHGAGAPLLANANFFHLHPVTLLFLILPYPTAFSLGLAGLSAAAAAGTALWLRLRGASDGAAAVGAAAFALGGLGASTSNLYNLHASYAAVPWALWASQRIGQAPGAANAAPLALALAAALGGGEPTAWVWSVALAVVLSGAWRGRRVALAHLAAMALSLGLCALQLLPLGEATGGTLRGRGFTLAEATRYSLAPGRLLEVVWPFAARDPTLPAGGPGVPAFGHLAAPLLYSVYAGVTVVVLGLLGLLGLPRGRERWALPALIVVSLLLALGANTPLFPLLFRLVPPLHYFRYPEKLLLPCFLVLAALAAAGADRLRARTPRIPIVVLLALVSFDLLRAHIRLVPGGPARRFLDAPPLASVLADRRTYFWLERETYVPPGEDLLSFHAAYVERAVPPAGLLYRVGYVFDLDPDRLDPLRMVRLAQLVHGRDEGRGLLPIAGVERVVSPAPLVLDGLELIGREPLFTYAVRDPVPLVRLVGAGAVRPVSGAEPAAAALAAVDFDPRRDVAYEGRVPAGPGDPGAVVRWRRPDPATLQIETEGGGLLVVNESFDPAWRATVDGARAMVAPANLAFLGVPIDGAGRHQVRLEYRPQSVTMGAGLSLVSLLACAALLLSDQLIRIRARNAATPSSNAARTT